MLALGFAGWGMAPASTAPAPAGGWSMGGHDYQNTRSNPGQTALSTSNASKLATKWTFTTHGDVSATPAVANAIADALGVAHVDMPFTSEKLWKIIHQS